jgi:hypothetical protein
MEFTDFLLEQLIRNSGKIRAIIAILLIVGGG